MSNQNAVPSNVQHNARGGGNHLSVNGLVYGGPDWHSVPGCSGPDRPIAEG